MSFVSLISICSQRDVFQIPPQTQMLNCKALDCQRDEILEYVNDEKRTMNR